MTNTEKNIYLELLRSALWKRKVDMTVFNGEWSWETLLDTFRKHDTLGLVTNEIILLPEEIKPSPQEMAFVYSYFGSLVQSHRRLNQKLAEVMPRLEEAGCKPMLLKGQGLSVLYPQSCVRSCGDLDIYVGEEKFDVAKDVVKSMATREEIEKAVGVSHHYQITVNGIVYEIHRTLGVAGNRNYKSAFLSEARQYLDTTPTATISLPVSTTVSTKIEVPALELNVWYVFNHLMEHFTDAGLSLRQFCDWMMVVREWNRAFAKNKEYGIKIKALEDTLRKIGLLRAWRILGGILVYQLGLPKEEFPLFFERLARKSQGFIVSDMLDGARFRFASLDDMKKQGHGLKHFLYNIKFYYYASRPQYVLSPWAPYKCCGKYLWGGLKHLTGTKTGTE